MPAISKSASIAAFEGVAATDALCNDGYVLHIPGGFESSRAPSQFVSDRNNRERRRVKKTAQYLSSAPRPAFSKAVRRSTASAALDKAQPLWAMEQYSHNLWLGMP